MIEKDLKQKMPKKIGEFFLTENEKKSLEDMIRLALSLYLTDDYNMGLNFDELNTLVKKLGLSKKFRDFIYEQYKTEYGK